MVFRKKETLKKLERAFSPRNVAVVGAARHNNYNWIRAHLPFHQKQGQVFHVNINEEEWPGASALGVKNFHALTDIPDPVDYVTVSVPRQVVPQVLQDCIKKEVAAVHVFSAGFGESKEEEGIRLDCVISELAEKEDLLVIGPNCTGLFNPAIGLRQGQNQYYDESGSFGYISQSGSQARFLSMEADRNGIKISKSISVGNCLVLDLPDFIDYLAQDGDTGFIGMYVL